MSVKNINRDERTEFVQNKAYKYGYDILTIGIFIYVAYRAIVFKEALWDLMGFTALIGFGLIVYQYKQRIFTIKGDKLFSFLLIVSAIIGTITFVFIYPKLR